jgi:hypothetical protein
MLIFWSEKDDQRKKLDEALKVGREILKAVLEVEGEAIRLPAGQLRVKTDQLWAKVEQLRAKIGENWTNSKRPESQMSWRMNSLASILLTWKPVSPSLIVQVNG